MPFGKYDNDDNKKIIMKDDEITTKETQYSDGSKRYLQIKDYDDDKHDTKIGYYNAANQRYVEAYHGENSDEDSKKMMGEAMNKALGK